MLRKFIRIALFVGATTLALSVGAPAEAASKHLTIMASVPDMAFPCFVYMMKEIKAEANRLSDITVVESDGERSSPKLSADLEAAITEGVDGIIIDPNDYYALAPALQEAISAKIPVVTIDRRARVPGILAHVSADNVTGGEAQGKLVMKPSCWLVEVPTAGYLTHRSHLRLEQVLRSQTKVWDAPNQYDIRINFRMLGSLPHEITLRSWSEKRPP